MVKKSELLENSLYLSLIGKELEVLDSKNPYLIGLKGLIVNETKNLFVIKTDKGMKKIVKHSIVFKVNIKGKNLKINGELLNLDIVTRIKKIKIKRSD